VVSTYQSVTGTGVRAVRQLENERAGISGEMAYPHPLDKNCLPHCDVFLDNGYTKEEMKMVNETRKILGDDSIQVTATAGEGTCCRRTLRISHVEFTKEYDCRYS